MSKKLFDYSECVTCKILHNRLIEKQIILRNLAIQRAINENCHYSIYFDDEDKELRILPLKKSIERGYNITEIVPRP